jgi:hypothetical protein
MRKIFNYKDVSLLFVLFFFINCSGKSNKLQNHFQKEVALNRFDSIDLENYGVLNPVDLFCTDSFIVIQNRGTENNLSLIDKNLSFTLNTVQRGDGPNEVVQFIPIENNRNNIITFADRVKRKMYSLEIDSKNIALIDEIQFDSSIPRFFSLNELNDNILIGTGMFSDGRFAVYNKKNRKVHYAGIYPQNNKSKQLDFPHIAALYSGTQIGLNPNGNYFASIYNGLLDIYKLNADNTLTHVRSNHYHFPKFLILENGPIIGNSKETIEGFRSISCDSDYIYLLYSGKSMKKYEMDAFSGNKIYVYNWQGEPVISYLVDSDIKSIFVKDKIIWGIEKDGLFIYKYLMK